MKRRKCKKIVWVGQSATSINRYMKQISINSIRSNHDEAIDGTNTSKNKI